MVNLRPHVYASVAGEWAVHLRLSLAFESLKNLVEVHILRLEVCPR